MKRIKKSVEIRAPGEKIWHVLLQDDTFRQWTSVFHPGSYAETDWKEGSKVLFKTPDGDGLVSKILLHKPAEIIEFEHQGILINGVENFDNDRVKNWKGTRETYRIDNVNGRLNFTIEQDISPEYYDSFSEIWEKALQNVKALSESSEQLS